VPKQARRESSFFRELKKQDVCNDEADERNDDGSEEEEPGHCGEVDHVVTPPHGADNTQLTSLHSTKDETGPAAATATDSGGDGDGDGDDVTGFTSLQSCASLHIIFHV